MGSGGLDKSKLICRECREGKHGACNGNMWVEIENDIEEVECLCVYTQHQIA